MANSTNTNLKLRITSTQQVLFVFTKPNLILQYILGNCCGFNGEIMDKFCQDWES